MYTTELNGHALNGAPTLDATGLAFAECVASLALRRLAARLDEGSADPLRSGRFLADHGDTVGENLHRGVRCALRALEIAVRGEALWDRVAVSLPREPRHLLLPQFWGLRDMFGRATPADQDSPAAAGLAGALQHLRQQADRGPANKVVWADLLAGTGLPEIAPDNIPAEAEVQLASLVADTLCRAAAEPLAQLLLLKSSHGELLFVGLVDFFVCRALQADPRVGAEFVFVHVQRPQELWEGDLETLARVVEQQAVRLVELLDEIPPAEGNGHRAAPRVASRGEQHDDIIERLFQQGLELYLIADYPGAIKHFSAALRNDPDHAVLLAYRGDAHRLLCAHDLAIADYSAALRLNPNTAAVLVQRAAVYRLQGELPRAVRDCSKAIALDDNQASAFTGRGDAYLDLGELDAAIADFSIAIELQPESVWGHFGRGQAHLRKQAYDEAVTDLSNVLAISPRHVPALLQRGDACRESGNAVQAILDYSEVLRYHPRNAAAYARRGLAFEQDGEIDRAIADYSQALRLDGKNAKVWCSRGTLLRRKGDLDRALSDLDESIRHEADNADAHYNRGLIFMARGLFTEAIADFDAALNLSPALIAGFLARALAQDALGRQPEGVQDCGRALRIDANCAAAYLIRGVLGSHMGQLAQALLDLTRTLEMDPNLPLAYHERGMVYMLQGEHDSAVGDYTRMLELNPGSALAYASRGIVRQLQGDHAQAVSDFARALELNPKSILAGWHQNTAEGIRRRTTQMLVEYIEGLWHGLQQSRSERRRKTTGPRPRPPHAPDGAPTAEHPAMPQANDPPPAAATVSAGPVDAAAAADETAVELMLQEATESEAPVEGAGAAPTVADPVDEAPPPPPMIYQCPSCKAIGVPSERLPDRRVRCSSCNAAFLPTRMPTLTAASQAPKPAAGTPPPKGKPKKPAADDADVERLRFTLVQKIILGTAAAVTGIVLLYYFFPSFESLGAAAAGPSGKRVSADDLLGEFVKNRKAAGRKYEEADLCVSGEVADVFEDKQLVRFKGRDARHFIDAGFRSVADMKGVQKSQKVSISGECAGWQKSGNVLLMSCKVFPYEEPIQVPLGFNK